MRHIAIVVSSTTIAYFSAIFDENILIVREWPKWLWFQFRKILPILIWLLLLHGVLDHMMLRLRYVAYYFIVVSFYIF